MSPATATATASAKATDGSNSKVHARDAEPIKTLTNPFIPPTSCHDAFLPTTTITESSYSLSPTTVWELQLASTEGCIPSGSYPTSGPLSFSPAVCPSGWTAYDMSGDSSYKMKTASVEFHARCCTSGFNLTYIYASPVASGSLMCGQQVSSAVAITDGIHTVISRAARIHTPWLIAWKATDTSSLSPAPPNLAPTCTNIQLSTWVPGSPADVTALPCGTAQAQEDQSDDSFMSLIYFLIIGLPIIGLACIAACITCCVCSSRRKKARRRAAAEAATLATVVAAYDQQPPPAYSLEQYGGQSSDSGGTEGQGVGAVRDGEDDEAAKIATTMPAPAYQPR